MDNLHLLPDCPSFSPLEKHQKPQVLHMFFVVNGAKGTEEGAN